MNSNRRNFLRRTSMLGAGLVAAQPANAQHQHPETKSAAPSVLPSKAPSQPETLGAP
ncbi:MAG: twin-arginine translocation signal domain-containing protein, partial [Acidobacteria bacterium]|nr:twin-arginine translocation signal domain-containing protein [Acidobacteriota bacterium]